MGANRAVIFWALFLSGSGLLVFSPALQAQTKDPELLEAKKRLPVHPWHKERVDNIRKETLQETIQNLANIDDNHFAMTVGSGDADGTPEGEAIRIAYLFRVRRLLEEGTRQRRRVVPMLKKALIDSLRSWPKAFREELFLYHRLKGVVPKPEPDLHDKAQIIATVSTYVLAELGEHEALPLLLASQRLQNRWIQAIPLERYYHIPQCPVPVPISLYSMHRLVSTHPKDRLPAGATEALARYMTWAKKNVPPPKRLIAARWNADYDESSIRLRIMDPNRVLFRDQPMMEVYRYPTVFSDGEDMQKYPAAPYISERSREWFGLIEAFVQAAYGETDPLPIDADASVKALVEARDAVEKLRQQERPAK